ncbi:Cof-type HAD-IIB family hydrolase [Streptococcus sp. DD13]|uniref:Cof-type HAD-IIB family hydrolase n=1 Tax=Streptococcus sp. DD13 TaxID=1777881 RepID=UPI00082EBC29|nr:Cof-type HAD-IIB family hydrolase [Streptococcus sp. DD13]
MKHKVIALDLDGTLLTPNGDITDYTKKTLQRIRQEGHQIVIATGRPYRMALHYYRELQLDTPMINFNGSLIHIPEKKWAGERHYLLDKKYLLEFLEQAETFEADFIAGEYKHKFFLTQDHLDSIDPQLFGVEKIGPETEMKPERITSDPHSILMQTRAKDKYQLAEEMNRYFDYGLEINTWGGPLNILETCGKGVNKATALAYLLETMNRTAADLIAFGDEHNDVEMLQFAQIGYAMKNASNTLIPHADRRTSFSNQEDGVARELEALFL